MFVKMIAVIGTSSALVAMLFGRFDIAASTMAMIAWFEVRELRDELARQRWKDG